MKELTYSKFSTARKEAVQEGKIEVGEDKKMKCLGCGSERIKNMKCAVCGIVYKMKGPGTMVVDIKATEEAEKEQAEKEK